MAVLIDLSKPLISKIEIRNRTYCLEYESLPQICFQCGIYGHVEAECLEKKRTEVEKGLEQGSGSAPREDAGVHKQGPDVDKDKFGPWMQVKRNFRRNTSGRGAYSGVERTVGVPDQGVGSRFDVLSSVPVEEEAVGEGRVDRPESSAGRAVVPSRSRPIQRANIAIHSVRPAATRQAAARNATDRPAAAGPDATGRHSQPATREGSNDVQQTRHTRPTETLLASGAVPADSDHPAAHIFPLLTSLDPSRHVAVKAVELALPSGKSVVVENKESRPNVKFRDNDNGAVVASGEDGLDDVQLDDADVGLRSASDSDMSDGEEVPAYVFE